MGHPYPLLGGIQEYPACAERKESAIGRPYHLLTGTWVHLALGLGRDLHPGPSQSPITRG